MTAARSLRETQAAFLDRVMLTNGRDPGDDALPMAPERLEVYRGMVLGGYQMMLTFVFTESMRLLDHELAATPAADGATGRADLIARMVATNPARTHSTREIADRFLAFFPAAYPDLLARRPELPDLMQIERAELQANYADDDPGRAATEEDVQRLSSSDVEHFLATSVLRAPSASLLFLVYPAATLQDEIRVRNFPKSPAPAAQTVAVSRAPKTLQPVVRAHAEPGGSVLAALTSGEVATVEVLAERWLQTLPEAEAARGEEALFRMFGDAVLRALGDGFLRLPE